MLDVLIVGGGPAGLSAALVLGRCRRKVLVCDAGHPRNESSREMHGFLSRDCMPPAEFLQISREQLRRYENVEFRRIKVIGAERSEDAFNVILENGERATTRILLLATGIVDECPDLEGFSQFYGRTVHHCPYCDGWEHRDQPIAVFGCKPEAADLAIELRNWSKDLVLCAGGKPRFGRKQRTKLEQLNIRVIPLEVARLEGEDDQLTGIRFVDGSFLARQALFFSPGQRQPSELGEKLGCDFDKLGAIKCAKNASTCVPGLFVAGNASVGLQLVIIAAAEGTEAAFAINQSLIEADANRV